MPKDLIPPHPAELVSQITSVIRASGLRTVHYTGHADEGLLRELLAIEPEISLSVMDMPDRWKTGFAFFWEERDFPSTPCPELPDWLEEVRFYQEGASDHEIAIRDWPWDSPDQLDRIVRFIGRPPPKLLIIFGEAETYGAGLEWVVSESEAKQVPVHKPADFRHPSYQWEKLGEIWIGRWIPGQPPLKPYPEDDEEDEEEEENPQP